MTDEGKVGQLFLVSIPDGLGDLLAFLTGAKIGNVILFGSSCEDRRRSPP
ncbi:MAG: hypothetical protein ACLVL7_05555 [Anaerotruncus massiliensis (ex Togo et al. 2019)]